MSCYAGSRSQPTCRIGIAVRLRLREARQTHSPDGLRQLIERCPPLIEQCGERLSAPTDRFGASGRPWCLRVDWFPRQAALMPYRLRAAVDAHAICALATTQLPLPRTCVGEEVERIKRRP